jgi:protocatechuate 3,4-dioxygenase beta subunit
MSRQPSASRREFLLRTSSAGVAAALPAWAFAASGARAPTLEMGDGPFYPRTIPLDHDNDLLRNADAPGVPEGDALDLRGRVLDTSGRALGGVRVEIWQCDAHGRYHHVGDPGNPSRLDLPFQGYGTFETGADGAYRFRTIKPVPYQGRTAHIHFKLAGPGFSGFSTQMFVAGEPKNADDWIYERIRDKQARDALTVALAPSTDPDAKFAGTFDLIVAADGRAELLR